MRNPNQSWDEYEAKLKLNFDTVNTVLKYDGDIPLNKVQCDHLASDGSADLYYIASYDDQYGDVDAFVVCDNDGNVSYYDSGNHELVYMNEQKDPIWNGVGHMPSMIVDSLEGIINNYGFDCPDYLRKEMNMPPIERGIQQYLLRMKLSMKYS